MIVNSMPVERSSKDYAIEFGRYLAKAAEDFMSETNRAWEAEESPNPEYWGHLRSAIYEFHKRADRAARQPEMSATPPTVPAVDEAA